MEQAAKKFKMKMPHTYVIVACLIILAVFLTWIVPAGRFDRVKNEAGQNVVVPGSYKSIDNKPDSLLSIPDRIVQSLYTSQDIIFIVLVVGGAFQVIIATGMFQAFASRIVKRFANKEAVFIPAIMAIFALACTTEGVNTFIGFAPLGIMLARAMGYDAIVGAGMVMLGGAIGFSTGTLNPYTTGIAQGIAELKQFSGIELRFASLLIFLAITSMYLIAYARKVKAKPELSVVYDLEIQEKGLVKDVSEMPEITVRHFGVLAVVVVCFGLIIYGGHYWDWRLSNNTSMFLWMAIAGGIIGGLWPSQIATEFVKGARGLVFGALIVGFARTVALVLDDGKILDTVVVSLASLLSVLPALIQGAGMYLLHVVVNCFIVSGSGQATVTMPLMIPVADLIGMTRQTAILAFNFGDGFCNYVLPTSSALMGFLAASNIPYERWMKFMWKLFLIWYLVGSLILSFATAIGYK